MEELVPNSDSMLVLHMLLNILGTRILAISFDILFMADRVGSGKTLETYEKIWIQLRRFQFQKTHFLTTSDRVLLFMFLICLLKDLILPFSLVLCCIF